MDKSKTVYMYALGAIIVVCFFAVIYALIALSMPPANENMLYIMLGILGAKFSDVVGYFYGSSAGSAAKDSVIKDLKK
jgi:CDP-diglyceride synthetase